jgi:hypothetical protein
MTQSSESRFTVTGSLHGVPWKAKWARSSDLAIGTGTDFKQIWVVVWRDQSRHLSGAPDWDGTRDKDSWIRRLHPHVEAVFGEAPLENTPRVFLTLPSGLHSQIDLETLIGDHGPRRLFFEIRTLETTAILRNAMDLLRAPLPVEADVRASIAMHGDKKLYFAIAYGGDEAMSPLDDDKAAIHAQIRHTLGKVGHLGRMLYARELEVVLGKILHRVRRSGKSSTQTNAVGLKLALTLGDDSDLAAALPAVLDLIPAMNEYHIAGGGDGITVRDFEIFDNVNADAKVFA